MVTSQYFMFKIAGGLQLTDFGIVTRFPESKISWSDDGTMQQESCDYSSVVQSKSMHWNINVLL